jgi:DNA-binding CsgD family transcriptional regulator
MARPGETSLLGRSAVLDLVSTRLRQASEGQLQALFIEGEAGIGKSRILTSSLERAEEDGFDVFVGRGDEVERSRPFGPLSTALGFDDGADEKRAAIAHLMSGHVRTERGPIEPTRDPGLQFRLVDSIVELVEGIALQGPVALAIEDLQWADPSTIFAIHSLSRRLTGLPVALLFTLRPRPRTPELERLLAALARDGALQLEVDPLDSASVAQLVEELVAGAPGKALLEKVSGAAGNPLFVVELVKALQEEGSVELVDGGAELVEASMPPSLRLTILRRLSLLTDERTLELLQVASVLGSTFSIRDVATVLGRSMTSLFPPVQEAIAANVLEERQARIGFRHDLIREAIYADLPRDVRAALHLEAGRRLAAAGGPTLQVAEQLALGARPGDVEAVQWLHAAARQAARAAPSIAVELLQRALDLTAGNGEFRLPLIADLVPTLLWSGRPQDAEAHAREALAESPSPELEASLRLGLAHALSAQGRAQDVISEVGLAIGQSTATGDIRAQLLAQAANAHALMGDFDAAAAVARDAVAAGSLVRGEGAEMGLLVLSDVSRGRGELQASLRHADEALRSALARKGAGAHWRPEIFRAMALQSLDRFDDALDALAQGLRADEQQGNVSYVPVYHYQAATVLYCAGQWDEAVTRAEAGLAVADEVGLEMLVSWPHGLLALIAVHRDDIATATARLMKVEGHPTANQRPGAWLQLAASLLDEIRGDVMGALARLSAASDFDDARGIYNRIRVIGPELTRLAVSTGRRDLAERVAAALDAASELAPVPSLQATALRCRGLIDQDADLLRQSVEAYRVGPRRFDLALACEDAAGAVAKLGRAAEAKALFDEALAVYEDLGARRDLARTLGSMRQRGIGRRRRGARKRPDIGWEALTPAEMEVVQLAATGLTNPKIGQRLFISHRTVQTHLAHAFQKLDVSSRVQLAAAVARRAASK